MTDTWRHSITKAISAALTAAALLCSCSHYAENVGNDPRVPVRDKDAPYDGIDISSHQGYIEWDKVSSDKNICFVYAKATEGATYRSPHYTYNVAMAQRYGLLVGSYHYITSTSSIDEQFKNFAGFALKSAQDLVPMIDVEDRGKWSRIQLQDSVEKFCELVKAHYGVEPMIYSTIEFYNKNLSPRFNKYRLYIGRYNNNEPEISWEGKYTIWQNSETGIIPGINSYVDLCKYNSDGWIDDILMPQEEQ